MKVVICQAPFVVRMFPWGRGKGGNTTQKPGQGGGGNGPVAEGVQAELDRTGCAMMLAAWGALFSPRPFAASDGLDGPLSPGHLSELGIKEESQGFLAGFAGIGGGAGHKRKRVGLRFGALVT